MEAPSKPDDQDRLTNMVKEMGFFGLDIPKEYGGPGIDIVTRTLMAIEMSQHRAGLYAPCYGVFGGAGLAQLYEANDDQKERYLYPTLRGEKRGFFGLTEPSGGSDPARAIQTKGVKGRRRLGTQRVEDFHQRRPGGGGRGIRVVSGADEVEEAYARCRSEAGAAFGNDAVFVERFIPRARHIEVQVIGDGQGAVAHLGERECSLQRRHQKVVEFAPSPSISETTREQITGAATRMAMAVNYQSLGTFEFLIDEAGESRFAFIEANPRLQVEHTVTEEVTGIDLVRAQLRIAGGDRLSDVGLDQTSIPAARGYAIQARVNMERMEPDGNVRPSAGMLTTFEPPSGPGVRVDTYGYAGYTTNPNFDSLLAKVITYSGSDDFAGAVGRARRALSEFQIDGVETNLGFLGNALAHEDFARGAIHTRWVDDNIAELAAAAEPAPLAAGAGGDGASGLAGAQLNTKDPLAGLNYFREGSGTRSGQVGAVATAPGAQPAPEIVAPPPTPRRSAHRCRARSSRSPSPRATRSARGSRCS